MAGHDLTAGAALRLWEGEDGMTPVLQIKGVPRLFYVVIFSDSKTKTSTSRFVCTSRGRKSLSSARKRMTR
jgi:hypothetical protein